MKEIIKYNSEITDKFFSLTETITKESSFSSKDKEIILIGMFVIKRGLRGLETHIRRAFKYGATKDEVLSTILLALPVTGITDTNIAFEKAISILGDADEIN